MAHCVIKFVKYRKHKFSHLCCMYRPKNSTNCPKISVFGPKKQCFWPKIRTKHPYHQSNMVSFGRKFDKLQYDM